MLLRDIFVDAPFTEEEWFILMPARYTRQRADIYHELCR